MKHKLKTTLILTALAVGILHIINRFINTAATIKNFLLKDIGSYFNWRFGKIYYTKTGSGSPLLLVHDTTPYSSSHEWSQLIDKLSKKHTVYAIDLLGCGRSDKPNLTYTNFLYVQMITDFVKQVIKQRTDVAATGLSSSFIIMSCHNDLDLFNKIIMINPESLTKLNSIPGKYSKTTKLVMDLPIIGTTVYNMATNRNNIEYLFTEKYFYNPFRFKQNLVNTYYESAHLGEGGGKYLLSSINGFYVNVNITHALREINNSIFIIYGDKCENAKLTSESYLEINPSIESISVMDAKMLPQLETPDALYNHMCIFLS